MRDKELESGVEALPVTRLLGPDRCDRIMNKVSKIIEILEKRNVHKEGGRITMLSRMEELESQEYDETKTVEYIDELTTELANVLAYAKRNVMNAQRAEQRARGARPKKVSVLMNAAALLSEPRRAAFNLTRVPPTVNDMLRLSLKDNMETWRLIQDFWFEEILEALENAEPAEMRDMLPLRQAASVFVRYNTTRHLIDVNNCLVEKAILDALVHNRVIADDNAFTIPVIAHVRRVVPPGRAPSIQLVVIEECSKTDEFLATYNAYLDEAETHTPKG